jgi:hypothetical protein
MTMKQTSKAGRNDACPCGSGKKFKKCCELKQDTLRNRSNLVLLIVVGVLTVAGLVAGITSFATDRSHAAVPGGTWSPEHGHYH